MSSVSIWWNTCFWCAYVSFQNVSRNNSLWSRKPSHVVFTAEFLSHTYIGRVYSVSHASCTWFCYALLCFGYDIILGSSRFFLHPYPTGSYDCLNTIEATLKDMGKIHQSQTTTKYNKTLIMCIILGSYCRWSSRASVEWVIISLENGLLVILMFCAQRYVLVLIYRYSKHFMQHSTWGYMASDVYVNIGSGNGLLPDGTKLAIYPSQCWLTVNVAPGIHSRVIFTIFKISIAALCSKFTYFKS